MKRYFLLFIWLILAADAGAQTSDEGATQCQAGKIRYFGPLVGSNARARVQYPGDAGIDVTFYGLDLRLTHTPAYLRGAATVTLKATTPNLTQFFLDLTTRLTVDSVKTGSGSGGQRLAFTHQNNQLIIRPAQPLTTGQALTLTVFYQGNPASSTGFGAFAFATHGPDKAPVIWTLSEPYGARDWFPNKDNPGDKADSSAVSITAPPEFVSVSNGTLQRTVNNADGTRTYVWRQQYPIAPYLISLAMTNYVRYDTPFTYVERGQTRTMPVPHYLYAESLAAAQPVLDQTTDMLRVFSQRYGPYPFLAHQYGHAQFGWGGGMEHQTMSSMGGFGQGIVAHELAHQWFGDKITCRDWQNIWLNEGFATYSEQVYAEARAGADAYANGINALMTTARRAKGPLYVRNISSADSIFDYARTYAKGAVVLHMLRGVLGDSTFFRSIRAYTASPTVAYGTAATEDFQAIVEQTAGQKLDYFFRQWIYGEGFPAYQVTSQSSGGRQVRVRVVQPTGTNPAFFTMPVQLRLRSSAGDTTVTVLNNQADQTFDLTAKGSPSAVEFDPNNLILKTVTQTGTLVTALVEPPANALRLFPNPADDRLTVQFVLPATGPVNYRLISVTGQTVLNLTDSGVSAGPVTRPVSLPALPAGRYQLIVKTAAGRQSAAVLVR
jgi:aminopeptidase N